MEKIKNKTKTLSFRIDDSLNDLIEEFIEKTKLSKTEVITFFLKRGIGILKFENEESSILNAVLKIIKENNKVTPLDIKLIKTIYRLLDLDIIFQISSKNKITKDLSLNLINDLIGEQITPEEMLKHIKKMDGLIPHFSPYLLLAAKQEIQHNFLTKEKTKDTIFTIGITENVVKFINRQQ